jgi:hypothetical protein
LESADHIAKLAQKYYDNEGILCKIIPSAGFVQVSMISIGAGLNARADIESALTHSRMLEPYSEFALHAELGTDGCTAYKFSSRDAWAAGGIVFIDEKQLTGDQGSLGLERCVSGALDYINGFPVVDGYLNYLLLPEPETRAPIMGAIKACAKDGETDLLPPEESRDGITARPSLQCIKRKVAQ